MSEMYLLIPQSQFEPSRTTPLRQGMSQQSLVGLLTVVNLIRPTLLLN